MQDDTPPKIPSQVINPSDGSAGFVREVNQALDAIQGALQLGPERDSEERLQGDSVTVPKRSLEFSIHGPRFGLSYVERLRRGLCYHESIMASRVSI